MEYQSEGGSSMKKLHKIHKNKRQFPYTSCENCLKQVKEIEIEKTLSNEELTKHFYKIHPDSSLESWELDSYWSGRWKHYGYKVKHCKFGMNPNLKSPIRKKYKLVCIQCHTPFNCSAEIWRSSIDKRPLCQDCYLDGDDDWTHQYESDYNEEEMIEQGLIAQYGEC